MKVQPIHVLLQPIPLGNRKSVPWYEPAGGARELLEQFPDFTFSHLAWESHAWLGGYEIHYYAKDGGVLCHQCANDHLMRTIDPEDDQFYIVDADVHWEGPPIYCDHCGREIESEYGDPHEH